MTESKPAAVVVDHWPLVRLGVSRALGSAGIEVVAEADSGPEAVQLARHHPPDLIVLGDAAIDEVIDLTRAAKALPAAPKVIALLGQTSRDDLIALLDAGADATVLRSVTAEDLAGTVSQVLSGERVIGPAFLQLMMSVAAGEADPPPLVVVDGGDDKLTAKEREVLRHLATGATNQQIAEAMYITQATVKTHLAHIYAKLHVGGRHEALSRAIALGLLR